jgi:hypothetical protein
MDRKLDLAVGQKVAVKIEEGSNASRYKNMSLENINEWCFDGEVTKVGRRYITVKFGGWYEEQFEIDSDYRQKYTIGGSDYKLYLNRDEIMEEKEAENLYSNIKNNFNSWKNNNNYSLEQLKRIKAIIDENK